MTDETRPKTFEEWAAGPDILSGVSVVGIEEVLRAAWLAATERAARIAETHPHEPDECGCGQIAEKIRGGS